MPRGHVPLVLLGIDGASWDVIDDMIARGELPGFQRLKSHGVCGPLETFRPTESVSIWTSIGTGVDPSRHMIQTFMRRIPGTDQLVCTPSTDRRVPALWNIASRSDRTVLCVKWFASWPAEEVNGQMLSSRLEDDAGGLQTYPTDLYKQISDYRDKTILPTFPKPSTRNHIQVDDDQPPKPGMLMGRNRVQERMFDDTSVWLAARDLYRAGKPDLFMIYFKSLDRVQHFLWGAHKQAVRPDATEAQKQDGEVMFAWYRYFDSIIRELMQDPDRILMVVSDHGFQSIESVQQIHDMHDINPDLMLAHLGFLTRTPRDQTDWPHTQAYTTRLLPFSHRIDINLNRIGREPNGIVSDDQVSALVELLTGRLQSIRTTTGTPLFKSIKSAGSPDLICLLDETVSIEDAVLVDDQTVPLTTWIQVKEQPSGVHIDAPPGIFAMIGPGVRKGEWITTASVFDITPSSLYCLGLPIAEDVKGRCLTECFNPGQIRQRPITTVPSYGDRRVDSTLIHSDGDDRLKEELKALGYI